MAGLAGLWISQSNMVGHRSAHGGGALKLGIMAAVASCGQIAGVTGGADVAQSARCVHVRSRQRERRGVVVESRRRPVAGRVADGAVLREVGRNVIRHRSAQGRGALPSRQMAIDAGSRGRIKVVVVVDMAGSARRGNR